VKRLASLFEVFDNTMSVHLRENQPAMAKHGVPGNWKLEALNSDILFRDMLLDLADEIIEGATLQDNAFIEDDQDDVQVIQLANYRIVITYPPFSDAHEITVVRPTTQRTLNEYQLPDLLINRLEERAEGILIAGAPGHGKSTFAAALTTFFADTAKIIKTIEKPRDLQLDDRITQFTLLSDDIEKVGDVILLMRPDYVIFDEIRKNADFAVYTDMRLAGVGMIGVIHATQPIDAIQRFVSRVELGLIPSIIDTVIFIHNGVVDAVLSLKMVVKTPTGFRDESLARPVIEVKDFLDGVPLYEIFSFGEQVVVIPLGRQKKYVKSNSNRKRSRPQTSNLSSVLKDLAYSIDDFNLSDAHIERGGENAANVYMPEWAITFLYEQRRSVIREIERNSGYFLNFIAIDKDLEYTGKQIEIVENKKYVILKLGIDFSNQHVQLMIGPQVIMNASADKRGDVKLPRNKASTKRLERMMDSADSPLTVKAI
jgi:ATPase